MHCRSLPWVGFLRLRANPANCVLVSFVLAILCACHGKPRALAIHSLLSPAPVASLVPQVAALGPEKFLLSWQTPLVGGGYAFEMAIRDASQWSEVRQITSGDLSMFSADLPGVAVLPRGGLLAYWELNDSRGGDRYATAIQTSVSWDEGKTWSGALKPYGDALAGQHSFLSWFPSKEGIGLVWLDARQRAEVRHAARQMETTHDDHIGAIGLRYAAFNAEGKPMGDSFVDPITCECCPTSAAGTARGPVVVYRGRQEAPDTKPSEVRNDRPTVRDIYIARLDGGRWTKPHLVHADNWVINACPDNGPAVDAEGERVAVAWWTRSGDSPKVQVAFSNDAGETFGPALRVDQGKAEGQVTLALLPGGDAAVAGWLEDGRTWARFVSSAGALGPPIELGASPRHSRLPKWIAGRSRIFAVWTSLTSGVRQVKVSEIEL